MDDAVESSTTSAAAVDGAGVFISVVNAPSSPINIPTERGQHSPTDDEFDAFSSRFESVGRVDDGLVVDSDPFDPFSNAGSAKGSSGAVTSSCSSLISS